MKKLDYLILFLLSVLVLSLVGYFQSSPGYMDADYYFAGGTLLAENQGLNEPFIWNYLDNPQSVPHPAFTYWMPLAALISAASMAVAQKVDFSSARIGFLVLAASIAPLTAYLSYRLNRTRWGALDFRRAGINCGILPGISPHNRYFCNLHVIRNVIIAAGDTPGKSARKVALVTDPLGGRNPCRIDEFSEGRRDSLVGICYHHNASAA